MKAILKVGIILTVVIGLFSTACQSGTGRNEQSPEMRVENLETFARLYGYARWFHPSDEAQEIDWGKFAILGVQKVENIKSTDALRDTLYKLFLPILQGLQIYETLKPEEFNSKALLSPDPNAKPVAWQHYGVYLKGEPTIYQSRRTNKSGIEEVMFDRVPQFGEIIKEPIGSNLTCVLPLTLLTNDNSTYPQTDRSTLALLQSELENIRINKYSFDPQVNLASVIITWNVFQHFFPYFDVIETDWNKVLTETIDSTLTNKQKIDFFVTLNQMIAKLDDGHGVVFDLHIYPMPLIRTEYIENKIVITASNDTTLKRGDIIHEINEKSALEVLDEKEKMISGSPHLRRYRALNILTGKFDSDKMKNEHIYLLGNDNQGNTFVPDSTQLLIERDGKKQNIIAANMSEGNIFSNMIDERKYQLNTIVKIEPGIYYINMAKCTQDEFERKKEILANAKAVIYDQRNGNNLNFGHIIPYLIEKPVRSTWWNIPQTIYPDRKAVEFENSNWDIKPKQPLFKSKSIIINTPFVVSFGETMMGIIDHYNLATTIGEPTAGCNGNVNTIHLPCGYRVMFTGMKVLKHDGSQLYLKGFEPDYPVNKTIQAIKEGRDEYLEKALEVARQ